MDNNFGFNTEPSQEIKLNTRRYKVKKSQGYGVPSKGLIRSWRMVDPDCKFIPVLYINNRKIRAPRSDRNLISIPELRNYIRDMDCPVEDYEFELDSFEQLFYHYQLFGIEFYKTLSNKDMFDSLFTRDIKQLQISFGENGPEEVEIEEEFWDRKGPDVITETEDDLEMQSELSKLQPINQRISLT